MIEWRVIAEAPDYAVSNAGDVRRIVSDRRGLNKDRILKASPNGGGYLHVSLVKGRRKWTRAVHVIVALAFHGTRPTSAHAAAHNDGDKMNNAAENLRWATRSENEHDKIAHGTKSGWYARCPEKRPRGEQHGCSKLSSADVAQIRADRRTQVVIAVDYGISQSHVSDIKRGNVWQPIAVLEKPNA